MKNKPDFTDVDVASRRVYVLVLDLMDEGLSDTAILSALAGAVLELSDGSSAVLDGMKFAAQNRGSWRETLDS